MPTFKNPVTPIKIKGTTNYPDLELTLADTLTGNDVITLGEVKGDERMIAMLAVLIIDWNLTDEKDKKIEPTFEFLKTMDLSDIYEIYAKYNEEAAKVKKSSKAK